jgi:hypothetical protein
MSYFLTSKEDIDYLFKKDEWLTYSFKFTKTEEVIKYAIKYFTIEYVDEYDFEKTPLNPLEYHSDSEIHSQKWDINYLDKQLVISDFEDDLKQGILEEQEYHLTQLENTLLKAYNELQIKNELNNFLEKVNKSIEALTNLKVNKYQKITINLFLKSYKETIFYLNSKYEDYIPKPKTDELVKKFINHTKINSFYTLETTLIKNEFIKKANNGLYWNNKKGYKIKMINFCRLLEHHKYLNQYVGIDRMIDFLEERYNINIGDQAKPSKYLKRSIKLIEPDFSFLRF